MKKHMLFNYPTALITVKFESSPVKQIHTSLHRLHQQMETFTHLFHRTFLTCVPVLSSTCG